ncbi:TPA: hypothetical protein NHR53_006196 [Pseudomonas aeruginosa]|uniref:hypothetical protein n=1 Tax=Pseudomonas aeruginosa TaxID=287 RepID=UPI00080313E7|nr:hypothetical protein [Pseudomonas aeruginosa]OBY20774.1 hypothetical protein A8O37_25630 [Pseudomonas aeruginosa]HCE7248295.1 hypothetical protein [Pseudomonas aeruginosa]HCE8129599.1 hypothetical protein [Pseudomonas aeruginosa]HCF0447736.1 hypothetical protein [Pseudomonas aeruginosa]
MSSEKDQLRAELERQLERYTEVLGGEVTVYAAEPVPDKRPWRKCFPSRATALVYQLADN